MTHRARALALGLLLAALVGLLPSGVVLGAGPMYFNVLLGGCISGSVPIEATSVDVVWRDAVGHVKVAFTVGTTNDGTWKAPNWVCRGYHAVSGDTLREHVTQPTTLTHTFNVPPMLGSFDRASGVTAGVAPNTGSFLVATWAQYLSRPKFYTRGIVYPARDTAGNWSYDWSNAIGGWHPRGGDRADAVWTGPSSDSVTLRMRVPFLEASVGSARVTGYTAPFHPVRVTLRAADGTVRGTAQMNTRAFGTFVLTFRQNGTAVPVNDGDRIVGNWAPNATYIARAISIPYDQSADWVNAVCNRPSEVGMWGIWANATYPFFDGDTHADGTTGPIDLVGTHQLSLGDQIHLVCGNSRGDRMHDSVVVHTVHG